MDVPRRVLTASGSRVHLSTDAAWKYETAGQWKQGYWTGQTMCGHAVLWPPDLPVNDAGEVEYETDPDERAHRPVDCSRCLGYARNHIRNIERVLAGEW